MTDDDFDRADVAQRADDEGDDMHARSHDFDPSLSFRERLERKLVKHPTPPPTTKEIHT